MTPLFLIGTALSVLCSLAGANAGLIPFGEGRIVNGEETTIDKFPHQLALLNQNEHWCGASILNEKWALTAAHCVNEFEYQDFKLCSGATKLDCKDGKKHKIKRIIEHPDYSMEEELDMDFCLIEIVDTFPINGNPKAKAIKLATQEVPDGTWATVSGWGALLENGASPKKLQKVDVPVISTSKCAKYYGKDVTENMICAGFEEGKKDSCQGDSGGPLITMNGDEPIQIGVVSWGTGCAGPMKPGVYSNVPKAISWIEETTGMTIS